MTSVNFCAVSGESEGTFVNSKKKAKHEDLRGNWNI